MGATQRMKWYWAGGTLLLIVVLLGGIALFGQMTQLDTSIESQGSLPQAASQF